MIDAQTDRLRTDYDQSRFQISRLEEALMPLYPTRLYSPCQITYEVLQPLPKGKQRNHNDAFLGASKNSNQVSGR